MNIGQKVCFYLATGECVEGTLKSLGASTFRVAYKNEVYTFLFNGERYGTHSRVTQKRAHYYGVGTGITVPMGQFQCLS
jgi:hypothetical protein